jgi:hypothetical protein
MVLVRLLLLWQLGPRQPELDDRLDQAREMRPSALACSDNSSAAVGDFSQYPKEARHSSALDSAVALFGDDLGVGGIM